MVHLPSRRYNLPDPVTILQVRHHLLSRCRRATISSKCLGSIYTLFRIYQNEPKVQAVRKTLIGKELDITNDGCPVAQPKLTSLPSARTMISLPLMVYLSTWGFYLGWPRVSYLTMPCQFHCQNARNIAYHRFVLHIIEVLCRDYVFLLPVAR